MEGRDFSAPAHLLSERATLVHRAASRISSSGHGSVQHAPHFPAGKILSISLTDGGAFRFVRFSLIRLRFCGSLIRIIHTISKNSECSCLDLIIACLGCLGFLMKCSSEKKPKM